MGLDTVEFVLWAERAFEIEIPDRDAENLLTVGQFSTYVHHKLLDVQGSNTLSKEEIFGRIKTFLVFEFKIAPERISRDSHFVSDLRLDR